MNLIDYAAHAASACFLVNALPHLFQGLSGHYFQSPFAKPPGVGESSPVINVWWGAFNLVVGLALINVGQFQLGMNLSTLLFAVFGLAFASAIASHFGKVRNPEAH